MTDLPQSVPAGPWKSLKLAILRFFPVWRQHGRLAAGAYLAGFAASALLVIMPWPLKIIIDDVLLTEAMPTWLPAGWTREGAVVLLALGAAAIALLSAASSALEKNLNARVREAMTLSLRAKAMDHLMRMSLLDHQRRRTGELALSLVDDTSHVARLFSKIIPNVFRQVITNLLTLVAMFFVHWALGLIGLCILLLLTLIVRRSATSIQATSRAKRKREGRVAGFAQEILSGIGWIQATGSERPVGQKFDSENRESLAAGIAETKTAVSLERIMQMANGIALALITGGGAWLALKGHLTVGALTVCVAYLAQLLKPVERINELTSTMMQATVRAERLAGILDGPEGLPVSPLPRGPLNAEGHLTLTDVSFRYNDEAAPSLDHINLHLPPRQTVFVQGRSGAGKSTLLALLLRLYDPETGCLLLDGIPYTDWPVEGLRRQFSIVLQSPFILSGSLREAVSPVSTVPDAAIWRALEGSGLKSFAEALPQGLDTAIQERGTNLSGGERSRLALARALLEDRPFLILDEPFANVDDVARSQILKTLSVERGRRTLIIVSHLPLPEGFADRTLVVEDGRVREISQPVLSPNSREQRP